MNARLEGDHFKMNKQATLKTAFEQAGAARIENVAQQIITFTTGSENMASTIANIQDAIYIGSQRGGTKWTGATLILNGIEEYLSATPLVTKYVYGLGVADKRIIELSLNLATIAGYKNKLLQRQVKGKSYILEFTEQTQIQLGQLLNLPVPQLVNLTDEDVKKALPEIDNPLVSPFVIFEAEHSSLGAQAFLLRDAIMSDEKEGILNKTTKAEKIFTVLQSYPEDSDGFYKKVFGGESLASILAMEDPQEMGYAYMRYMNHLPKDQVIWREVADALFLSLVYPLSILDDTSLHEGRDGNFLKKLYDMQCWFASKLLYPVFTPLPEDAIFVSAFSEMASSMNVYTLDRFSLRLIESPRMRPIVALRETEENIGDILANHPIYANRQGEYPDIFQNPEVLFSAYREVIIRHKKDITKHLSGRFPNARLFVDSLDLMQDSYVMQDTKNLLNVLPTRADAILTAVESFTQGEENIFTVRKHMWEQVRDAFYKKGYTSDLLYEAYPVAGSIMEKAGITTVRLAKGKTPKHPVVLFTLEGTQQNVVGELSDEGELINLSIDEEQAGAAVAILNLLTMYILKMYGESQATNTTDRFMKERKGRKKKLPIISPDDATDALLKYIQEDEV